MADSSKPVIIFKRKLMGLDDAKAFCLECAELSKKYLRVLVQRAIGKDGKEVYEFEVPTDTFHPRYIHRRIDTVRLVSTKEPIDLVVYLTP